MAFIKTTAPADAEGEVRSMYERQQQSWGYIPNYAKIFSDRPEVLARWGRLLAEIKRPMPPRRFELVTLAAALALRNTACALQHGKLLAEFVPEADVIGLSDGKFGESFSEAEQALFHFAQKVARDASRITSGDVDRLKRFGLDDEEIFDVVAAAAGRAFFTKLLDGLGVETDSSFMDLAQPFRQALTVGRPIGFRPVESLPPPVPAGATSP